MIDYSLSQLKRTKAFLPLYSKLISKHDMSIGEKTNLLKLAIIFLNSSDKYIKEFGYRLVLKYCNNYQDYIPLYTVALNMGFIPIAKYIESNHLPRFSEQSFNNVFTSAFAENFRQKDIYLTEEQYELNLFFKEYNQGNIALVAPTSYGKSELILSLINKNKLSNICILVPTKALLAQTKKRILKSDTFTLDRKIITHPEMYQSTDKNFIAVLTQERLLRLLQRNKQLFFDFVIVDEAHNILEDESRANLLATAIIILNYRNDSTKFKFLTPFLLDTRNIDIKYTNLDIKGFIVEENIKSENYYFCDFRGDKKLKFYDQYLSSHFELEDCSNLDDMQFIIDRAGEKNVVYLNRPPHIEDVAKRLLKKTKLIDSPEITKACNDIREYIHKDYLLIKCLKHGIVYHHGSVPDNIRLYLEHLFSIIPELKFIITSSTLLEGVNIPADKIFILSHRKGLRSLSHAQLKNLVGRVSRFKDIFDNETGSLHKLEPEVYLVKSFYMQANANPLNYLSKTVKVDKIYEEKPENVLLDSTPNDVANQEKLRQSAEFIENQEPGITKLRNVKYAQTEVGTFCFRNNITEFNILDYEYEMQKNIDLLRLEDSRIDTSEEIIKWLVRIFIYLIDDDNNISRLNHESAQKFYRMFLDWKIEQASYKEMVSSFLNYWETLIRRGRDTVVFVDKWGDMVRVNPNNNRLSFRPLWTDIKGKEVSERINLAIVRIKDEQDFLENKIMKFIETMYDLDLIEQKLYFQIKYGTDDDYIVTMIKNGIGFHTAKLLETKYRKYILINIKEATMTIKPEILVAMKGNLENEIVIFEVSNNIR